MVKVGASHVKTRVKSMPGREVSLSSGKDLGKNFVSQNREQNEIGRERVSKVLRCKQQLYPAGSCRPRKLACPKHNV